MMPNRSIHFSDRLHDLVSDWTAYHHDITSDWRKSRLYYDTCGQHEVEAMELRVMKNSTRFNLSADILNALVNIESLSAGRTRATTVNQLVQMFEKANDQYLDCIIDYNLITDDVTKMEFEAAIEVLRTLITDLNNLNVNGD